MDVPDNLTTCGSIREVLGKNRADESSETLNMNGAQGRNRTTDTRIFSPLLYRLSYLGIAIICGMARKKSAY